MKKGEDEWIDRLKRLELVPSVATNSTSPASASSRIASSLCSSSSSSSRKKKIFTAEISSELSGSLQNLRRSSKDTVWETNGEDCFGGKGKKYLAANSDSYMALCYDSENSKTYYTECELGKNESSDKTVKRLKTWQGDPTGSYRKTYKHSDLDRGHLIPRADYNTNEERNWTLDYKNAAPQAPDLNRKGWLCLENAIRSLVKDGSIIITGTTGEIKRIQNWLTVPKYFYKMFKTKDNQPRYVVALNKNYESTNQTELEKLGKSNCDQIFDGKQLSKMLPYLACLSEEDFLNIFPEEDKLSARSLIDEFKRRN